MFKEINVRRFMWLVYAIKTNGIKEVRNYFCCMHHTYQNENIPLQNLHMVSLAIVHFNLVSRFRHYYRVVNAPTKFYRLRTYSLDVSTLRQARHESKIEASLIIEQHRSDMRRFADRLTLSCFSV